MAKGSRKLCWQAWMEEYRSCWHEFWVAFFIAGGCYAIFELDHAYQIVDTIGKYGDTHGKIIHVLLVLAIMAWVIVAFFSALVAVLTFAYSWVILFWAIVGWIFAFGPRGEEYLSRREIEEREAYYTDDYDDGDYDDYDSGYSAPIVNEVHHYHETERVVERPIEHKPFPERKPSPPPPPRPKPKPQPVFEIQRLNRGGYWETKGKFNNLRQAEQQMRNFQSGAYRTQDANQPNVQWRVIGNDGYEL